MAGNERHDASTCDKVLYANAWAAPLLLVAVGIWRSNDGENFMGYGSDGACWMSWKHRGIIYLFFIPSGLAMVINITSVAATALSLIQIQSAQSASLTVIRIIGIVARISISMGLEWIVGLVLYFAPHHLGLQYAFVLVIGLHGLWLLISTLTLSIWDKFRKQTAAYLCGAVD